MESAWFAQKLLYHMVDKYDDKLVVSCSFGAPEGMIIIHMISQYHKNFRVCTIDTGRIPQPTFNLIDKAKERYDFDLDIIYPNYEKLSQMVRAKGMNSFYESIENRKECCDIRKVQPFDDYLVKNRIQMVVTGLRQEQSEARQKVKQLELDKYDNCAKLNPLYDWTRDEVMNYVKIHDIPINSLNYQGYESVGCAPCTRAGMGRDGRWWWETESNKECGLHSEGSGI